MSGEDRIRYIRTSVLLASDAESARTYYHYASDEMGSVTHVADGENEEILNRYEYDAWGSLTTCEEKVHNRFKFNGQQYDPISQQYYLRARYYNPVIGRFTQEDSYNVDGLNLYAYCRNNPVYYVDPSGNICDSAAQKIMDKFNMNGTFTASHNEQKKLAAYLRNKDRNGTPLTPMETRILNQISDYTYLPRYGQDVPSHIYTPDDNGDWHRSTNGRYVSHAEMGIEKPTPDPVDKVHGNSKKSTNEQHVYEIYEKATNDVVKTGLSGQPLNKDGSSPRANTQVNALNKECGYPKYDSRVVITGIPDRVQGLQKESENALRLKMRGIQCLFIKDQVHGRISRMKLKEIELDIPYKESEVRLQQIQEKRGIDRQEAIKIDYVLNWKAKRKRFQLETRCMTAMIERIMKPVKTENCWKLLFECYEENEEDEIVKLLGVYVVRTKFCLEKFWEGDDYNKKKMIIETILTKVNEIKSNITFDLENVNMACEKIIALGYVNEWVWGKPLKLGEKYVRIEMKHEVQEMYIYMVFFYAKGEIINKILLAHTVPDEWNYYEYLGKLVKISDNSAALVTKKGERLIGVCKND